MSTILVVDVGNTSTSIGYYEHGAVHSVGRCDSYFEDLKAVLPLVTIHPVDQVVIATVVPGVVDRWVELLDFAKLPSPLFVSTDLELGVPVDYPDPSAIGPDRLANAAIAADVFGTPVVVCDFGTALTFDVIDETRGYIGGVICPGLPLMFDYLSEKTALLPRVEPVKTESAIGRNTVQAMQIGARLGYRGMVREVLSEIQKELGVDQLKICCTGGYAGWIFDEWDIEATVDPDLTLKGIGRIGELNR